jgi:hypothetical protein
VLGQDDTRESAALAYPNLGLQDVVTDFGFTGIGGKQGTGIEALNAFVPDRGGVAEARSFWWATIVRATMRASDGQAVKLATAHELSSDWEAREELLEKCERSLKKRGKTLLIVYDALDTVATEWPRRRAITEALFEVVWAMRAYRNIRVKVFLRPDQIDDDALRFVELPKLRTGAVRLTWTPTDLYGLLYARIALAVPVEAQKAFGRLLALCAIAKATRAQILAREWPLSHDAGEQSRVMSVLAGQFMADGTFGYKKGKTFDWPLTHLADAFDEVTPRSFLGLLIAAAQYGAPPEGRVITPDGIRHGLRAASKTRVDQLNLEFPWIKAVLAPLAGLLLPLDEKAVFKAWRRSKTIDVLVEDASKRRYLLPFEEADPNESNLFEAMRKIGVMFRRKDERIDMPDLFRVAAKLLKKGGTAPV